MHYTSVWIYSLRPHAWSVNVLIWSNWSCKPRTPFRSAKVLVHFHHSPMNIYVFVRGQSAISLISQHTCIAISRRKFASANRCSKNDSAAAGPPSIIYPLPWHNTEWIAAGPQHTHTTHNTRERIRERRPAPPYAQWNCNCARAHYFHIYVRARAAASVFRAFYLWRSCNNSETERCVERVIACWPQVLSPRARISIRWGVFYGLGWSEKYECICRVDDESNNQVEMGFRRNYR